MAGRDPAGTTHAIIALVLRLGLLLFVVSACAARQRLELRPTPSQVAPPGPVVGVGRVDVTPSPGWALGGHGPNGLSAAGHRGRLECSAVYLGDAAGEAFLWVGCDFAFVSALLHRRVAERIHASPRADARCAALGSDRIAISASHTHAGPAHVLDALGYTEPTPRADGFAPLHPGLDLELLELLTDRIASAALEACADASRSAPAELRWSHAEVKGFSANQSVEATCANRDATCGPAPDPRAHVAAALDVLQVLRGGATAAVVFFYGIHPTAVPNGNDVFHADLVEAARLRIRHGWNAGPLEPRAALVFVNGAEGDVGAASELPPGFRRARSVGRALGDAVLDAVKQPGGTEPLVVSRSARDFAVAGGQALDGDERPLPCGTEGWAPPSDAALCPLGWTGAAAAGGSEDGPTLYRQFPFNYGEGLTSGHSGCQAPKRPIVLGLFDESGPCVYPEVAPMLRVQLGSRAVLTLPYEVTHVAARRIGGDAIVACLTNGYSQYVTTEEEYALQRYEGASTLYGPGQARFLAERAARLARSADSVQRSWKTEVELGPPRSLDRLFDRPEHAVLPEAEPCAPLDVAVRADDVAGLAVRVTDASGEVRVSSLGAEVTDQVQDVEVRLTPEGAVARWHPEACPVEGEVACIEAGSRRRCATFRDGAWR